MDIQAVKARPPHRSLNRSLKAARRPVRRFSSFPGSLETLSSEEMTRANRAERAHARPTDCNPRVGSLNPSTGPRFKLPFAQRDPGE